VFAAVVAWWPRAVDLAAPAPPVEERFVFVPLDGDPDDQSPGACAEMLDELVAYPGWELQVTDLASGCMGTDTLRHVTIAASGRMTWREPDMPERHVMLTGSELDAVRALNQLGCEREYHGDYGERFFRFGWGAADTTGGIHIASQTPMGHRLDFVIDGAIARYTAARLAAIQPASVHVKSSRYRLDVDSTGALTVRRGRRVVAHEQLDPQALVDVLDLLAAGRPAMDRELVLARGSATIAGRRVPVELAGWGEPYALRPLIYALETAADTGR
jgi:hypothetical protein